MHNNDPKIPSKAAYTWGVIGIATAATFCYLTLAIILDVLLIILVDFLVGDQSLQNTLANHASQAGVIIAAALVLPIFYSILSLKQNLRLYLKPPSKRGLLIALKYFGFYFIFAALFHLILYLFDWRQSPSSSELLFGSEILLTFVGLAIVAPIIEEIIFRGYFYAKLRQRHKFWPAFGISGSIFTVIHIFSQGIIPLPFIFVAAFFMTRAFEKTRNLWISIIIHFLHNAHIFLFLYLTWY